MQSRRRKLMIGLLCLPILSLFAFLPVSDSLPHPQKAVLQQEDGLNLQLQLNVFWYDLGLRKEFYEQTLDFDANGQAPIPALKVQTPLWKYAKKKILSPFDAWTDCENCDGPRVDCSLRLKDKASAPANMRFAQNQMKQQNAVILTASLIPDERKFDAREFKPGDVSGLLIEAKALIAKGDKPNIPRAQFGPQLLQVNPVRVECGYSSQILWMGGNIGYVLVPGRNDCPVINMAWTTGTEYRHIYKVERISKTEPTKRKESGA